MYVSRDLGFIDVSSAERVGCVFIHPAQPTDAPSSSRSHFYTPGFPRGWPPNLFTNVAGDTILQFLKEIDLYTKI
jgi:hypothetical protein